MQTNQSCPTLVVYMYAYLRGEEVWEALAGEPVDVVDRVPLPRQRVHEHSCSSCYRCLRDLYSLKGLGLNRIC